MMLSNEKIQSENEFSAFCAVHGKNFVKIAEYVKEALKKSVFTAEKSSERDQLVHKVNNLDEVINLVQNAATETYSQNLNI